MNTKLLLAAGLIISLGAFAQTTTTTQTTVIQRSSHAPIFRVNITSRSVVAVKYQHRSGSTHVDFAGTDLMPAANGEAKVESERGSIKIRAEFGNLQSPTTFGNEYLTYVLWAISPEGRAQNLGEVLVGDNKRSKVEVATDLQSFALIVTAEPYYAVRQPSNAVVLENIIRDNTKGTAETVNARYELTERGGYIPTGYNFDPVVLNTKLPLEFFEARNALRIAQSEGAETYAGSSYQHAVQLMNRVDEYAISKHIDHKQLIAVAREAVQTAEDARAIAVKNIEQQRLADERQASADAQLAAQTQTNDAVQQRNQAQTDAAVALAAKSRAESDALTAQNAKAQAEFDAAAARTQAADAQSATAQAQEQLVANQAASASALATSQANAETSRMAAQQQSEADKAALRAKLSAQLNLILQTRDSARGLIVSMSDVLFDTGKYSLKSGAREKLAKVAGILLAYPSLNIAVGGYTDNVGGDEMNQKLSDNRADSVRDYLVQEGVARTSVSAEGYGNTSPVATNDNSAGRQQNRRVELVVSGEAIGTTTTVAVETIQ